MAVVHGARLEFFSGNGFVDLVSRRSITENTVFRIASITKTFSAISVMQRAERGLTDLDAHAADYLRAYSLVSADPSFRPATVRHLLTHTAGIGETAHPAKVLRPDFGESVPPGEPIPALSDYYRGGLRIQAEPGTRWTYSNHRFATLGQIVADVSGIPLTQYPRAKVFEPLGMTDTDLAPVVRRATGYTLRGSGPRAVADREMVTAGAASVYSTPRDMARYLAALLGGANEFGVVLESDTLATMFEAQYQPDPRIPGMGLAFFVASRVAIGSSNTRASLPGFDSQIWLAPDDGLGIFACTNGAHRAMLWLPAEVSEMMNDLLGACGNPIRADVAHHPEIWPDICGHYRLPGPSPIFAPVP
ncbi:serine hydrolase domain-containing protein [Nocardia vinacea]|uniref:serine hydrolase domain-containing protein n=1 Tax=Nocardia vinacea TaxID=96468 RepID=UPI0033F13330